MDPKNIADFENYKFLGWQNGWNHVYFDEAGNITKDPEQRKTFGYTEKDYPEYGKCQRLQHNVQEHHIGNRGVENTVWCNICKIYWKYDCSD